MKKILTLLLAAVAFLCLLAAALLFYRASPPAAKPDPEPMRTTEPGQTTAPTPAVPIPSESAPQPMPVPEGTPEPESSPSAPAGTADDLPVGKWFITAERKAYREDSLTLFLPAINITRAVHNGTDIATLNRGVGLYEYAQLPGEGNRNVSIAGHRNGLDKNGRITDHAPFYYVDELADGDYLYLYDSGHIYRYLYESTWVVEADDWAPIATTGESCLTLTSCTPIGVSDHRIIVRGVLDEIFPYSKNFTFLAHAPEEKKAP